MKNQLNFQNHQIVSIVRDNELWFTANQVAQCLEYGSYGKSISSGKGVSKSLKYKGDIESMPPTYCEHGKKAVLNLYRANKDEFTPSMVREIKIKENFVTVFNLRGVHLLAMFSRTAKAKEFRKWVLDILEKHESKPQQQTLPVEQKIVVDHRLTEEQRSYLDNIECRLYKIYNAIHNVQSLHKTARAVQNQEISDQTYQLADNLMQSTQRDHEVIVMNVNRLVGGGNYFSYDTVKGIYYNPTKRSM
jgi:prophage antirepressor-like protein